MNIIFFGTSKFAVPSLVTLVDAGHNVKLVVTQPDKKSGRHLHLTAPPIKVAAAGYNLPIYQPEGVAGFEAIDFLKAQEADLFVVVSFGEILRKEILEIPKLFAINVHGSLLPKYRGAAPVHWAVINGDEKTGVTVMKMNEKMDEGDIILQKEITIRKNDTSEVLDEHLSGVGAKLLAEAIDLIKNGKARFIKQDGSRATYAPKLKKEDGHIDWQKDAMSVCSLVRGTVPWPGAFTYFDGKILKICATEAVEVGQISARCGEVISVDKKGIIVNTAKGGILIKELQLEGARRMDSHSFLAGHKLGVGAVLG